MKVVLASAWFLPEATGGTELYVADLATGLRSLGVDVVVAVPSTNPVYDTRYRHGDIVVRRFAADPDASPRLDLTAGAPASWLTLLEEERPDVVDVHSLTTDLGVAHLHAASSAGARTVTTLHLPGLVCARGTLMRFGTEPCDGDLAVQPCTVCRLHGQGLPAVVGHALSIVPPGIGRSAARVRLPRVIQRPLMTSLAHEERVALVTAMADSSDCVVALSKWQAEMLMRNGVPRRKVRVSPQGVRTGGQTGRPHVRTSTADALRVGFVGRFDPVKGLHVLLDAIRRLTANAGNSSSIHVELHVWGIAQTPEAKAYERDMLRMAADLPAVTFHGRADGLEAFREIDVLAVPSVWFETGPLVVLEAHAAGIPVIGSNIGGIAERVQHDVDGLLVPPGSPEALAAAIQTLASDGGALERLSPRRPVRTMADVACEAHSRYQDLLEPVSA